MMKEAITWQKQKNRNRKVGQRANITFTTTRSRNGLVWFMLFNAIFNNISVISWLSLLLAEKTTDLPQSSVWDNDLMGLIYN
jgi:hypothetical protein